MSESYTSPDARGKWWDLYDLALTLLLSVAMVLAVVGQHWEKAIFFLLLLMANTLWEIGREVRASRRLAEITLRRRFWVEGIR